MRIETQVTSLELSKKLKSLGFKQESLFYHIRLSDTPDGREDWLIKNTKWGNDCLYECSAYTVAELANILPPILVDKQFEDNVYLDLEITKELEDEWSVYYVHNTFEIYKEVGKDEHNNLSNALARALIYLKENNLI